VGPLSHVNNVKSQYILHRTTWSPMTLDDLGGWLMSGLSATENFWTD